MIITNRSLYLLTLRAVGWAVLGGGSGVAAHGLIAPFRRLLFYLEIGSVLGPLSDILLPGLLLGLAIFFLLWRRGLAGWRHAVALPTLSILAWNSGALFPQSFANIIFSPMLPFGALMWSATLTAGLVALFPFARRPVLWLALTAPGGFLAVLGFNMSMLFLFDYWPVWFAVYAGILSLALPVGGNLAYPAQSHTRCHVDAKMNFQPEQPVDETAESNQFGLSKTRIWHWAGLGALSGALATGMLSPIATVMTFYNSLMNPRPIIIDYFPPGSMLHLLLPSGLTFAIVAGIAMRRLWLVTNWQIAGLIAVSVLAWHGGYFVTALINPAPLILYTEYLGFGLASPALDLAWPFLVGGLVWGAVQIAGTAIIFPFARRGDLIIGSIAAGGVTAWLAAEVFLPASQTKHIYPALWIIWYAVHAAILSTVLPNNKELAPPKDNELLVSQ